MPNGPKEHNFQLIKVEVDLESGKIHPGRGLQPEKELRPLSAPTERDICQLGTGPKQSNLRMC